MSVNPVKNPFTLNVPPVLFVNVAVPLFELYVPPVTKISVGRPKYVVAEKIPLTVNPVMLFIVALYVPPVTSNMVNVLFKYVNPLIPVPVPPPPVVNFLQVDVLPPPL